MESVKRWEWQTNIYDLKTFDEATTTVWNCSPYVMICGLGSGLGNPDVYVHLEMSRPFLYSSEAGWHWHKSWKLPSFKVQIEIGKSDTEAEISCPENLVFSVYATTLERTASSKVIFAQLNLQGQTSIRVKNGSAYLDGLKFEDTSYNLQGGKIHLMWSISFQDEITQKGAPKILYSKISPPIFVDSRTGAIESLSVKKSLPQLLKQTELKPACSKNDTHKVLDAKLVTRQQEIGNQKKPKSGSKSGQLAEITPNLAGLMLYLKATDLKKESNFLFYLLRFSSVFSIYLPGSQHQISQSPRKLFELFSIESSTSNMPSDFSTQDIGLKVVIQMPDLLQGLQIARTVFMELSRLWPKSKVEFLLDPESIPPGYFQLQLDSSNELLLVHLRNMFTEGSQSSNLEVGMGADTPKTSKTEQTAEITPEAEAKEPNLTFAAVGDTTVRFRYTINPDAIEREFGLTTLDLLKIPVINLQKKDTATSKPRPTFTEDDLEHFPAGSCVLTLRLWRSEMSRQEKGRTSDRLPFPANSETSKH